MRVSIAIVDDHVLIAKALTEILHKLDRYEVLYEVENGKELIDKIKNSNSLPEVILLDVSMPVMNGFETATWLRANHPEILIMALSMQDDEESLIKMIKAGASGYLLKNIQPKALDHAIQTLIEKGFYYPDWATSKVLMSLANTNSKSDTLISFSDRELEFFKYVCTEMSYKEIADKMFCSPRTIEGYRDSLFEKLNCKTRVGLAVYAMKHKLCSI